MSRAFNPIGMPVALAAGTGHSLNGGIRDGGEATLDHSDDYSLGTFDTEYGPYQVFYCPTDDDCYIYLGGVYTSVGFGDAWIDLCP